MEDLYFPKSLRLMLKPRGAKSGIVSSVHKVAELLLYKWPDEGGPKVAAFELEPRGSPDLVWTGPPRPHQSDEASEFYITRTVTRKKEAGIVVASLVLAWFCRLNSRSSSFCICSALPVLAAASKAFMVGP